MEVNTKVAAAMIALGAGSRLLPHPWNFTPMMAIGLFSGAKSSKLRTGVLPTVAALLLSDAVMGFYRGMWYVYAASLIPVFIGRFIARREGVAPIVAGGLVASLSFFLTTNFMVWASGHMYPHTAAGLIACFVAGVPFYENELIGDALYVAALFGGHAVVSRLAQPSAQTA